MTDKLKELKDRIAELTGAQARIALLVVASGDPIEKALDIAESFDDEFGK